MAHNKLLAFVGLGVGLLGWLTGGVARGEDTAATVEVIPAPPGAPQVAQPAVPYGPLQASPDAYQMAELERRAAINRQLALLEQTCWYNRWVSPYLPHLPRVAPYGVVLPRHAFRPGYVTLLAPWPQAPGGAPVYRPPANSRQPIGHEKTWTGPNSYIYRPIYGPPPVAQSAPSPTVAAAPPPAPTPAAPVTQAQRPDSGPREF